jgi:hypothetical protein
MELHKRPRHDHGGPAPSAVHAIGGKAPLRTARRGGAGGSLQHFATFANEYKDVLKFADADEAEAVFGMVSLGKDAAGWQVCTHGRCDPV